MHGHVALGAIFLVLGPLSPPPMGSQVSFGAPPPHGSVCASEPFGNRHNGVGSGTDAGQLVADRAFQESVCQPFPRAGKAGERDLTEEWPRIQ